MPTTPPTPTRPRARRAAALAALLAAALPAALLPAVLVGGCAVSPAAAPTAVQSTAAAAAPAVPSSPAGTAMPAPGATITAGPVPPAAEQTAVRYWRLVDAHRYRALLGVVTPDSPAAAAVRAGGGGAFWGIARARVVSVEPTVSPLPPPGATLEFAVTVAIRPARTTSWSAGRTLVFMSLRRVGGSWLVCETGTGP